MGSNEAQTLGIYVSIPFCRAKCSFCNFSSDVGSADSVARYVTRLCSEIEQARRRAGALGCELAEAVDTVYFGGGTPSLLQPLQLRRIFQALRSCFSLTDDAEITMEAAPGQISADLLEEAQRQGTNRISLGVQSFVDREAAAVGRQHTGRGALEELQRLQREGIAERGVDLIAGLPHQTAASWQQSLESAAGSASTHLSVYMLELDEDSRLGREVIAGGSRFHAHQVGSDELIADLYETACACLPADDFAQYEISNFARGFGRQHQSRHNRKYWERASYLGFGLDAHSMLRRSSDGSVETAVRFANSAEMHDFEMGVEGIRPAVVSEREAFEETVFLGLRLLEGISLPVLRDRWPNAWVSECETASTELVAEGLMQRSQHRLTLTTRGRLLSNDVFGHLLNGVAV